MVKKNRIKQTLFTFVVFFSVISLLTLNEIQANAQNLKAETTKKYLFTVPGDVWSTCTVHIIYDEYYNNAGSNNVFYKRTRWYTGSCTYTTNKPQLSISNVVHRSSNGNVLKTFSSWTGIDGLFPGGLDYYGTDKNTVSVTYPTATSNKGELGYIVTCSGAFIPIYTDKVSMKLNTI